MPAPANVAEFIDVVRKSGLITDDRLNTELARLRASPATTYSIDQLASALIQAGLLTRFQAKQIKIGRYKRFEIAGKYKLLELLGVGGMGAVYLCEHVFMKRLVALKVLPVEKLEDQSSLLRFYREARAVASLDHPNIVKAFDIDKYEQLHFFVMEYVDGASIQEIVAKHGPLDPIRAANYVAQAAHGLHHAHELGMVHRDIKPGNLLLERTGVIKILDMGLARFFDQKSDNVTEKFDNNCVLGTADYLAPEQAMSNVVDIRADIYALGGSLYYMLTGQSPFPDGTIAGKLISHQTKDPRPVSEFRPDVPQELVALLAKMMRKDPADRFQTPAEVFDAFAIWGDAPVPPPANEMPDLCPAVLALSGHAADRTKTTTTRLLAGGGRSSMHTSLSSSAVRTLPAETPPARAGNPMTQTSATSTSPTMPLPPDLLGAVNSTAPNGQLGESEIDLRTGSTQRPVAPKKPWAEPATVVQRPLMSTERWILLGLLFLLAIGLGVLAAWLL
jgi:serine/threonine protein kinase